MYGSEDLDPYQNVTDPGTNLQNGMPGKWAAIAMNTVAHQKTYVEIQKPKPRSTVSIPVLRIRIQDPERF
jgi:hypothetical protein